MGAARRLVILTEASNGNESATEGASNPRGVPGERHAEDAIPSSSKLSTTSTMTTAMETPPLPRFRVPALPPSRYRQQQHHQQQQQQQQWSLLPPTELGRRVTSTVRRSQMFQATPYKRNMSTWGVDSTAREGTTSMKDADGPGADSGVNGGGVLERIKGIVGWLLSGLTRMGVPSASMSSPDESSSCLGDNPPGRGARGSSGEMVTVLRQRLALSRTMSVESEAEHHQSHQSLDRHYPSVPLSSPSSSSSSSSPRSMIQGTAMNMEMEPEMGTSTGMGMGTRPEAGERKVSREGWRTEQETADSRNEIYQRLVGGAIIATNRRNLQRRAIYGDLAHFFRACSQQPALLTREEYEELSLLIQRQGVRRQGSLARREGRDDEQKNKDMRMDMDMTMEMEMAKEKEKEKEMMREDDGTKEGPMEGTIIEKVSPSVTTSSSLLASGAVPPSTTAKEAVATTPSIMTEDEGGEEGALAILPPPPGSSPSPIRRAIGGALHGRPPLKRTARIFSARFDEDEDEDEDEREEGEGRRGTKSLTMGRGDGFKILGRRHSSQGGAAISENRRRLIEEARRRVAEQIRLATMTTQETEGTGTGTGTRAEITGASKPAMAASGGEGTAKEMGTPLINLDASTPMRKKSVSFAPDVVKFEFTIPATAGGTREEERTTGGGGGGAPPPPKLIFDFDGMGGKRTPALTAATVADMNNRDQAGITTSKGIKLAAVPEEAPLPSSSSSSSSSFSGEAAKRKEMMGSVPAAAAAAAASSSSTAPLASVGVLEFPSATTTIKIPSASTSSSSSRAGEWTKEKTLFTVRTGGTIGAEAPASTTNATAPLSTFKFGGADTNTASSSREGGTTTTLGPSPLLPPPSSSALSLAPPRFSFGAPTGGEGGREASSKAPFSFPLSAAPPAGTGTNNAESQPLSFTAFGHGTGGEAKPAGSTISSGGGIFPPPTTTTTGTDSNGTGAGAGVGAREASSGTAHAGSLTGREGAPPSFTFGMTAGEVRPSARTTTTIGGVAPSTTFTSFGTDLGPGKSASSSGTMIDPSVGGGPVDKPLAPSPTFPMPTSSAAAGGGGSSSTVPTGTTLAFGTFGSSTATSTGESSLSKSSAVPSFSFGANTGNAGGAGADTAARSLAGGFSFGAPPSPLAGVTTGGAFGFGNNATVAAGTGVGMGTNAPSSASPTNNASGPFTFGGGGGGAGGGTAPSTSTPFGSTFSFTGTGGGGAIPSTTAMGSTVPPPFGMTGPLATTSTGSPFSSGPSNPFGSTTAAGSASTLAAPSSTTTSVAPFSFGGPPPPPSATSTSTPMQFNFGATAATPSTVPFTFGVGGGTGGSTVPGGASDTTTQQPSSSSSGTAASTRKFSVPATRRRK